MKVALLEVSHWHFPLYLESLDRLDVEIVGVSDREDYRGKDVASRYSCPLVSDYRHLLDDTEINFAFAFGRHADMYQIATSLIERGIPFAIEKPCGISRSEVAALRRHAEDADLYVAVPFIFRLSDLLDRLGRLEGRLPSDFNHLSVRFNAGAPSRYLDSGCGWMLDPEMSGGGCTINLAGHFIDLFRTVTGKEIERVNCTMNSGTHRTSIEDYSVLVLMTGDGTVGVIETGYTYPNGPDQQREFSFSLSSGSHYVQSHSGGIIVRDRGRPEDGSAKIPLRLNTDDYYPIFVERVIADYLNGNQPIAGFPEAEAVAQVMDAAYASALDGGATITL